MIDEIDHLEREKVRFHRHRCCESEEVQKAMAEMDAMREELQRKGREAEQERIEMRNALQAQMEKCLKRE